MFLNYLSIVLIKAMFFIRFDLNYKLMLRKIEQEKVSFNKQKSCLMSVKYFFSKIDYTIDQIFRLEFGSFLLSILNYLQEKNKKLT